ncbi:MAG TPA: TetR/AcrR family transcriptional regulator [Myxococcales bacterium]|jgi:TetR/AcrR family transcriptional regulator
MVAAADNRTKLLACALRLFVSKGYDGVGVQEIVEAAGVTKPTLYHYFGSKQGLLETLLAEEIAELEERLQAACDYRHDLPKTLTDIARACFEFAKGHREVYRLLLSLYFAPLESDACRAAVRWHDKHFAMVEKVFEAAEKDHGNMRGRHQAYAATFTGMIDRYIALALNGHTHLDDVLLHQAVKQFQHGIYS